MKKIAMVAVVTVVLLAGMQHVRAQRPVGGHDCWGGADVYVLHL